MSKILKHGRHGERGQILPLIAVGIFALLGMVALAVDVGYWRYEQRLQQSAADSAAIAAGIESNNVTPAAAPSAVPSAGRADAASNGFTDGVNGTTVTINYPPASTDAFAASAPDAFGKYDAVQAIVTRVQPAFFGGIFGGGRTTVTTRAVAITQNNGSDCLYALNRNSTASFAGITINGSGAGITETSTQGGVTSTNNFAIYAPSCGVITDSVLTVNGGAANIADQTIGFVTSAQYNNHATFYGGQPTNANYTPDPCPSIPACNAFYLATLGPTAPIPTTAGSCTTVAPYVCTPGIYASQISFSGNQSVTFMPGVYVLNQGLNFGGSTSATGTGVTFYNAGTSSTSTFTMAGSGNTDIKAPVIGTDSSGNPIYGLVYYQTNSNLVQWGGHSNIVNLQGISYMPNAELKLDGNAPNVTQLVVNDLVVNGGGIAVKGPNLTSSSLLRHFVLAE